MKKILNEQVLSELNRMREIMGLSIINEGVIDARTRMILKSLGYTDSYIDNIVGKTVDDLDLDSLADEFATIGVKNSDDLVKKAAAEAGVSSIDDVSEEAILGYIKKNPKIMSSIESKVASMARQAAESSVRNLEASKIFPTDVLDMMKEISDMDLSTPGLSDDLDEIIKFFDDKVVSIGQKGGVVPDSLLQLRKQFAEQKKSIESIGANKSKPTIDTGATKPKDPLEIENEKLRLQKQELENAKSDLESVKKWIKGEQDYKDLSWMKGIIPNRYQKQVLAKIDGYLNDLLSGKITLDELTENAQTELNRQMLKKENKLLKKQGTALERFLQKNPKTVKYGVLATLAAGTLAMITYGGFALWAKEAYKNNKDVILGSELDECFETVTGWSDLDSDVKNKFAGLGYSCLNRNKDEAPNEFITAVKYVAANPQTGTAEKFIITIGGQNKTILASGTDTKTNTNTNTPSNCPGQSSFETAVKNAYGANYDSSKMGTFDGTKCTGTYDGDTYTWNGSDWE
jgi:hypothetical protein